MTNQQTIEAVATVLPVLKDMAAKLHHDPDYLDRLITQEAASDFLGYSEKTLERWRYEGGGPRYVAVSARSVRYRRRDLIKWAEARLRENSQQKPGEAA